MIWEAKIPWSDFAEALLDEPHVERTLVREGRWSNTFRYVWRTDMSPTGFAAAEVGEPATESQGGIEDYNGDTVNVWSVKPRQVTKTVYADA